MATIKETFFISITEADIADLRAGKVVKKLALTDSFLNGDIEETWVELSPVEPDSKIVANPMSGLVHKG